MVCIIATSSHSQLFLHSRNTGNIKNYLDYDNFFCKKGKTEFKRTSDGGSGNHSVSLPIILIKIKVYQMLPSSYISSLLVSIL